MAEPKPDRRTLRGLRASLKPYMQPRTIVMLLFGFASGLPFYLIFQTLSIWLREEGISRGEIGLFAWVGFAFTIKYLWAPVLDRTPVPFLDRLIGRRRAWMAVAQAMVAASLLAMSAAHPADNLVYVAVIAICIAFAAATQDIAVDAWRIEAAPESEQGVMAAMYQLGYRFGIILSSAGALLIADAVSWPAAYQTMAGVMIVAMSVALFAPRVEVRAYVAPERQSLRDTIASAVVGPFMDFFRRYGWTAFAILALISLYRVPDFVMGFMTGPLYIDIGYTKTEIGLIVKGFGPWMTILGALIGGVAVTRFDLRYCLLGGVAVQALSNLVYAWLATVSPEQTHLIVAIVSDNLAYGFAGTVLIAYMSSLTNTAFTATQYALFSSFYALPGKFVGGFSGFVVDAVGYPVFFVYTALTGIPAAILVLIMLRKSAAFGAPPKIARTASADGEPATPDAS